MKKYHHCVKFTYPLSFQTRIPKVDQHTGGKWLIHGTKHRKDNQLQSLELIKMDRDDKTNIMGKWRTGRKPVYSDCPVSLILAFISYISGVFQNVAQLVCILVYIFINI